MTNLILLLLGTCLLVVQGIFSYVLHNEVMAPGLVLPMVLYMSVGEFSITRGVSLSFVLGYLSDVFAGGSIGLWTFAFVSSFLLVRVAGLKLFLHGIVFQIALTFIAWCFVNFEMMALLLVFDRRPLAVLPAARNIVMQAFATALTAPLVFGLMRRLPGTLSGVDEE
jgi:cell shape-determining protein MreD